MRRFEQLFRSLAVRLDHCCSGLALNRVGDGGEVEAVVGGRMEDVNGFNRSGTRLLIPEYQVDPVVQCFC